MLHSKFDGSGITFSDGNRWARVSGSNTSSCKTKSSKKDNKKARACPKQEEMLEGQMPQKKYFRSRAHCNPLSHNDAFD